MESRQQKAGEIENCMVAGKKKNLKMNEINNWEKRRRNRQQRSEICDKT